MNKSLRKTVIAGNWKMNKNRAEAKALVAELAPLVKDAGCGVICCVPYTDLSAAIEAAKGSNIMIGAQNCHWAEAGAFTGEISADMLAELGVEYVVIGHSERRQYFGETDETVNQRVRAALDAGLTVILCVGELLHQRENNITEEICSMQTKIALKGVTAEELERVIIAYEPVWAIGTGKTATAEQADEVNGYIRGVVESLYGKAAADGMTIQYGGSMNAQNAAELLKKPNVDGGLIGGASLKAEDFAAIVRAAQNSGAGENL
jgi:triosephosphate isomerase